jgi:hypothetical protein
MPQTLKDLDHPPLIKPSPSIHKLAVMDRVPGGSLLKHETIPLYQNQAFVPYRGGTGKGFHEIMRCKITRFNKHSRTFCLNATNRTIRQRVYERGDGQTEQVTRMQVSGECRFRDRNGSFR